MNAKTAPAKKGNQEKLKKIVDHLAKHHEQALMVLALVMLFAGKAVVYTPGMTKIAVLREKISVEKDQEKAITEIRREMQQLNAYADKFPVQSEKNWWLDYIAKVAKESGIRITQLMPQPMEDLGNYMLLGVGLEIKGKFHDLGKFVALLENADKIIRVDKLEINRGADTKDKDIRARLRLTTIAMKS